MKAINTNNQIVKFDYPIKDLRENVQFKQKELSHELDSTPLKRENYCKENEIVLKEHLKLDKESIVSLQNEKPISLNSSNGFFSSDSLRKKQDIGQYLKENLKCLSAIFDSSGISKKMNPDDFFQRLVKNAKDICEGSNFTYKVDIAGRKVSYFNDDFRLIQTHEVYEGEKNTTDVKIVYWNCMDFDDYDISSNSIENKIEENTFSSSSSHFLDEYLKQKDFSNQFLIHQLIDNKLLKNLNLIV